MFKITCSKLKSNFIVKFIKFKNTTPIKILLPRVFRNLNKYIIYLY